MRLIIDVEYKKSINGIYSEITGVKSYSTPFIENIEEAEKMIDKIIVENGAIITLYTMPTDTMISDNVNREKSFYCRFYAEYCDTYGYLKKTADKQTELTEKLSFNNIKKLIHEELHTIFYKILLTDAESYEPAHPELYRTIPNFETVLKAIRDTYKFNNYVPDKKLYLADARFIYNGIVSKICNDYNTTEIDGLKHLLDTIPDYSTPEIKQLRTFIEEVNR